MPDGNFQDYVILSQDTLSHIGASFQVGTTSASTVGIGFSGSGGMLALLAAPTADMTINLPTSGGTLLTNVNFSAGTTSQNLSNVVFANANNVSFGLNGSTITASVNADALAIGAIAAGTQTATSGTVVYSNSNNVSFGMSNSSVVTASANSMAAAAGTQTATSGTVVFSNSNGVSFGMSNSSVITASYTQSTSPAAISAGTTSASSGTIVFSNSNNVSFGMNGNTVTASATVASSQASINFSAGTTSQNLSAVTFSNSNNVSFGLNGSTITASANSLAAAAGTQTATSGTVVFSNSNGVSFGMSNSSVITASYTQSTSPAAIAAGTQTATSGTIVFSNSNNVSFGMSGSSQVTASAQVNISAGTTSNNVSAWTYSNANGVSFGLNASTITASVAQSVKMFSQDADFVTNFAHSQNTLSFQKVSFPGYLSATQMGVIIDVEGSSNSSGAFTLSHAVYTFNGSTASLASSASRQISWTSGSATSASSQYGGVSGTRYRTVSVNYNLTPGDYLFAWWVSTANAPNTLNIFGRAAMSLVGTYDGFETSHFLNGSSVSSVNAFPASVAATNTNYARTGAPALRQPGVIFVGTGAI